MKKTVLVALLVILVSVAGCTNTISGLGKDMKTTGERITDAMKED